MASAEVRKRAAYLWDRDTGDTETWDQLTPEEQQNVIDNYNITEE